MKNAIPIIVGLTLVLLTIAACGAAPTIAPAPTQAPPTTAPQPTAAVAQPTTPPQPTATTAPQATATAAPAATTVPQATTTTAQATAVPPTNVAPTATTAPAASAAPPGLYVTSMRLDPPQPTHTQSISFYVSFLNTASGDQNVKWVILIYRADNPTRSFSQTAVNQTAFSSGATADFAAPGSFKLGSTGNTCDYFSARVDQIDANNKETDMTTPDGKTFEKGFTICQ